MCPLHSSSTAINARYDYLIVSAFDETVPVAQRG